MAASPAPAPQDWSVILHFCNSVVVLNKSSTATLRKGIVMQLDLNLEKVNAELSTKQPKEIIAWASENFGQSLVMTSHFGAESALLLFMATRIVPDIPVILLDTGYLFPETYRFMEELRTRWNLNLKIYSSPLSPEKMEKVYGKLWERGEVGKKLYSLIRKIRPKQRALRELRAKAVLSGVRSYQTKTRSKLSCVELTPNGRYEVHPLLRWTEREVMAYFAVNDLPYHPLVAKGYDSIGDTHSTLPGKGREGRLLGPTMECGLHVPDYQI